MSMTYEAYLDEVTTLMTEKFDLSDEDAIKHVMRAQANDFFTLHDDLPEMRTQERAEQDAQTIFALKNKSRPHTPPKRPSLRPQAGTAKADGAPKGGGVPTGTGKGKGRGGATPGGKDKSGNGKVGK